MRYRNIAALGIGFALDCLLGDPHWMPHPVRLIGKQIEFEEGLLRKYVLDDLTGGAEEGQSSVAQTVLAGSEGGQDAEPVEAVVVESRAELDREQIERLSGYALLFDVATLVPVATWGLLKLSERVHPALALGVESFICYQLLAARSLRDESMNVYDALEQGNVEGARDAVAMIVGRDTDVLDEQGIARAAVETVAENSSDGVIAPMMYMAVGGAPAMMFYKAVNTLDSMVGYKNDRYINLGRASAKADDVLNYLPARVAGVLTVAASKIAGYNAERAWATFKRDRLAHSSPNSAHTEAAYAGALGVQLGGGNYYFGKYVDKPTIGDDIRPIEAGDIKRANGLMYATAGLALGVVAAVGFAAGFLRGRK